MIVNHYLLVVEDMVKAQGLEPFNLLCSSGISDDLATLDLGNLTNNAANSSSGSVDKDGLSLLWLAELEESKVGSVSRHTKGTKKE